MRWYLKVLKDYAVFQGRAHRTEYWSFVGINFLVGFGLGLLDGQIGTMDPASGFGVLSGVYALAVLIPGLAVSVRRLHDTGRSGWWLLIVLIPVLGGLVLLIFMLLDGESGANEYGPDPKGAAEAQAGAA